MRIPKVLFIIGLIMIVVGVATVFVAPATVTWKPKSDVIAKDEVVKALAPWQLKTDVLASEEIIKASALWESKTDTLLKDEIVEVPSFFQSYDYALAWVFSTLEEVKEDKYTIEGDVIETEGYAFDFYVFDETNYDLWKAGRAYTAYVKVKNVAEHRFKFALTKPKDVTVTLCFVVDTPLLLHRVVKISAVASWVEKAFFVYPGEFHAFGPLIGLESRDFVVEGDATETKGHKFNFHIFNKANYDLWKAGDPYTAYFEAKDVVTTSFSFPLTKREEVYDLYFVVENPPELTDRIVKLSATVTWVEKALFLAPSYFHPFVLPTIEEAKDFVVKGSAVETGGYKFNFYVLDGSNYDLWEAGKPFKAYFEAKDVTTTSFSFPLKEKGDIYDLYFVVENPDLTDKLVKISATLEWDEKATITATIAGLALGGFIGFIGFILIIIAGIASLVFKTKN